MRSRLWQVEVQVTGDGPAAQEAMDFVAQDAAQPVAIEQQFHLHIHEQGGRFHLDKNGAGYLWEVTREQLMPSLLRETHRCFFEWDSSYVRIHAGLVDMGDRRILIFGDSGAGKTTLMMRLLLAGHRVQGDELALLKDDRARAFPRRFHLKASSACWLPELDLTRGSYPCMKLPSGSVYAVSPRELNAPWELEARPLDALVYLQSAFGTDSQLESASKLKTVERLMPRTFLHIDGDRHKIAPLCRLVDRTPCYVLRNGELKQSLHLLETLA